MFCFKCGTRVADDAIFCLNCGNRIAPEQPAGQHVVAEQSVAQPVVEEESVIQPIVEEAIIEPAMEQPVVQAPIVEETIAQPIFQQPVEQQTYQAPVQQPVYDHRQYVQHGTFQPATSQSNQQPVMSQINQQPNQSMYQQPAQNMYQQGYSQPYPQQAFYNTPAQLVKREKTSVPAIIFLIIAAIAAIVISVDQFIKGEAGMGIMNICYFATSIILIVYSVSSKKTGSILKGVFFALTLVLNIIFAGVAAFSASIDIFKNATAGTDYYYAVILILQYIILYVYLLVSIIRSFMNKKNASYAVCLLGYFVILLIIAAFVVDVVTDIGGLFALGFIPVDLGIVCIIAGDLFASLRKAKNQAEAESNI